MEKKIIFSLFIIAIFSSSNLRAQSITSDKALAIANEYAKQLKYPVDLCNITVEQNTLTVKSLKKKSVVWRQDDPITRSTLSKLKGRHFWFVYYSKKGGAMGGDLCVFVDSKSGKVLTHELGE